MVRKALRQTITELEAHRRSLPDADGQTARLLDNVIRELERQVEAEELLEDQGRSTLHARLQDTIREFEIAHPTAAATIGRLIDTLAQSGI